MFKWRWFILGPLAAVALVALVGVITWLRQPADQQAELGTQEEVALGLRAVPAVEARYGKEVEDAVMIAYVTRVGQRVVARSDVTRGVPYEFQFRVIQDARATTFSMPGGQVFITTGMLQLLDNEAELAALLAHEIGHVLGGHQEAHLQREGLSNALQALSQPGAGRGTPEVDQAIQELLNIRYGQMEEVQADAIAVGLLEDGGYAPQGLMQVMRKFRALKGTPNGIAFYDRHTWSPGRMDQIEQDIRQKRAYGGELGEARYKENVLVRLG